MNARLLLVAVAGLLLGANAAQDPAAKDVEKALNALNVAFQKQDAASIRKLMADSHVGVTPYYGGPQNKEEQLKSLADLKLTEYAMKDLKITLLGKDTALVTYSLALKGTYKGKPVPARNFASAIFVLQGGQWLEAYYQETALEGK